MKFPTYSTLEVANILQVERVAFYEWVIQGYILPTRTAKARGVSAEFDAQGVMAAGIFERLRKNIRRPIAGKISRWYQEHGSTKPGDVIYVKVANGSMDIKGAFELNDAIDNAHYLITIPTWSIRQWIESRIKEIQSHGREKPD